MSNPEFFWKNVDSLDQLVLDEKISLGRGNIISKIHIENNSGPYPIYSSSAKNNGKMGEYGEFMFNEELISWSVDGGGYFFYRPHHKFSLTNVSGYMKLNGEWNYKFVAYCLQFQHRYLSFDYQSKAHPSVIRELYFLPRLPLNTQNKIANILNSIDKSIKKTQQLIEKHTSIKQGLMADLFTRGIDITGSIETNKNYGQLRHNATDFPELYQETEIGNVPKEWSIVNFGDVVEVIDPNPSHRYPNESNDGIPICSTESFFGDDFFLIKKPKLVPNSTYEEQYKRCRYSESDVIFARKGRIGLARRYGHEKKAFSHTVVVMKPAVREVYDKWLLWVSRSYGFLHFIDKTMNTNLGVPTLGVDFIKKVPIILPCFEEQKLVAERLDNLSEIINTLDMELSKLELQKHGLMKDLLTGKVKVN